MYNLQTYKTPPNRWFVRESRPYDFLYDSTFTQPSREDFIKSAQYGLRSGARTTLRPVYHSMFSGLKNASRIRGCMQEMKPSVLENFMPEYDINGVPVIPADTGPLPLPRLVDEVTGANRAKYAIRYGPPKYKLDNFDFEPITTFEDGKKRKRNKMKYVNKSIQTDFRESECQTDPYSPPYFLPYPGAYPKLLALVKLTWEKGLPFSLDDIVIIERALSKRQLEYVDREVENEKDFEKRIKLMEELEAQQWADREKELDKLRQRKMELTNRLLHEYSSRVANDHTLRLERLHAKLKRKSQLNFDVIKHQYFRDLRKLERKYIHKEETRKRDIIKDYTQFDSRVYAPLTRNGGGIGTVGKKPNQFYWNFHDYDNLDKIMQDPDFIKQDLTFDVDGFRGRIEQCKPVGTIKRLEKKLEDIFVSFKGHGMKGKEQMNFMGDKGQYVDPNGRPVTPEIIISENRDEELRKPHIVLVQKIARGRTIQKLIRNEIDKNMNEILGLKLMYDMDPNCQHLEESRLQKLMAMKKNSEQDDSRDTPTEEVLGHLEGETMAKMIDFLDKEMIRLIDERKIHALILLAERDRKLKEAAEGGKRYHEEEARRANDEIFKQITGIHQATVDMYLEDIFLESCDRVADDQSRIHVQRLATTLNDALYSTRQSLTDFEQEELAADLVSSFMMPELHRLYHNSRIEAAGNRFTKASEQVVDAIFSSHPVTKKIMDELDPVVDEHLVRGTAALDGGVSVVDQVITQAVAVALKPFTDGILGEQEQNTQSQSQTTSSKETTTETTETKTDSSDQQKSTSSDDLTAFGFKKKKFDPKRFDFSKKSLSGGLSFAAPAKTSSDDLEPQDQVEEEEEEEAEEVVEVEEEQAEEEVSKIEESQMTVADSNALDEAEEGDEEEETDFADTHPPLRFYVSDDVVRSLAAKSVQVEYDTELGQQVDAMYTGAEVTVDDLFDEVTEKIIPKVVDDSASDATLSDDSDD